MGKKSPISAGGALPKPTGRELEIVRVLWERDAATVREVLDELNRDRPEPLAYTTVLRFLQIMTEKGLVTREDGELFQRLAGQELRRMGYESDDAWTLDLPDELCLEQRPDGRNRSD